MVRGSGSMGFNPLQSKSIRINQNGGSGGSELAKKTQDINQLITNISRVIIEIPAIRTEQLCLTVAAICEIRGFTVLQIVALCNDIETA